MRPKGLIRLLLTGCLLLLLSGCTFGATVDALLTPPHLRGEQEQIYQALENAVGNRITLQYPRSGDHLSAVMISDLDGDGQDEAAVFYRKESSLSTENALRLNLLDQADGTWMSVCDLPAEGAEVDRGLLSYSCIFRKALGDNGSTDCACRKRAWNQYVADTYFYTAS